MSHPATEHALLAVIAAHDRDHVAAADHIRRAQEQTRATARRQRQVVEIASLIVAGAPDRAAGLALEHAAEFPEDTELVTQMTRTERWRGVVDLQSSSSGPGAQDGHLGE